MLCDLLVHVDGGQAGRRRVQFAVDLALRIGARLSGIHVTPPLEVTAIKLSICHFKSTVFSVAYGS